MKISQLIAELQTRLEQHGDIEVDLRIAALGATEYEIFRNGSDLEGIVLPRWEDLPAHRREVWRSVARSRS